MKIQKDKLWHFLVAAGIALAVLLASHIWFPLHYNWDMALAFGVALLATITKELVWDMWWKKGTPELMDFFWGFVGAVVGPLLWLIVETILGTAEPLPNWM